MAETGRVSLKGFLLLVACLPVFSQSFEPDAATRAYLDLWRKGEYVKALEKLDYEIQRSIDGVPISWIQDRCQLWFATGRIFEAITELEWLHQRRPTPENTLQLAEFYFYSGRDRKAKQILKEMDDRFKRATRYEDDTSNDLALQRIREYLGANPRNLFQTILSFMPREKEPDHLQRYLAAGGLALRKFDYALSAEYYQKVLDIEEDNVQALVGLAGCYWKSWDPRLEEILERIRVINPVHPEARAIEIERKLDENLPEEALADIDEILAINENNLQFLGLKSAAYFLLDRDNAMEKIHEQAMMINPAASIIFRITGRIASRHYRFKEGLAFQTRAIQLNPEDNEARALMAFDLLRLGRDEEGRRQLAICFENDRYNVQVFNMLELMDVLAEFEKVESGPFVLKMPKPEIPIWGNEALALIQEAAQRYEKEYKLNLQAPVMLQIFDNHDDFMVRSVGLPGNVGHLGICFGQLITMDSPSARDKWAMNWKATLWHEFVHVITLQKTKNRMSRWLSEGISVFEETRRDPSWGNRLDAQYKGIVDEDGIPKLRDFEALFTKAPSGAHLMFGYFASGEFVRYYVNAFGFESLVEALDLIARKEGTEDALIQAAGIGEKELNKAFSVYMNQRVKALINLPKAPSFDDIKSGKVDAEMFTVSPFTDALKRGEAAIEKENWEKAEKEFKQAHELFPEYFGEDGPLNRLAVVYEKMGRDKEREAILEQTVELDPTNFPAFVALAKYHEDAKDWAGLRKIAEKALAVDPFDVPMNRRLFRALRPTDGKAALKLIDRLLALDPQDAHFYRLNRIDLLLEQGNRKKARNETLRLLDEAPYSWEAQKRLLSQAGESR